MPRRSRAPLIAATSPARRHAFPWHKHREIGPGLWFVIGDMSLIPGPPLEGCAVAGCLGP